MSRVILHGVPQSTYVRTARMVCEEKAIAYEVDPVLPGDMKHRGLHPFGRIPAMTHGEVRLFETAAIACYLDLTFDGPAMQPEDPVALSEMVQWISAINDTVYDAMVRRIVLQRGLRIMLDVAPTDERQTPRSENENGNNHHRDPHRKPHSFQPP